MLARVAQFLQRRQDSSTKRPRRKAPPWLIRTSIHRQAGPAMQAQPGATPALGFSPPGGRLIRHIRERGLMESPAAALAVHVNPAGSTMSTVLKAAHSGRFA